MTWLGLCMPRAGGTIYNELRKDSEFVVFSVEFDSFVI